MFKQIVMSTMLLAAPTALLAQSQPAALPAAAQANQPLTPQQSAAIRQQDETMERGAEQVAQMVDQGRIGEVWDGSSSIAKQTVTRDAFVKQVTADRTQVGKLVSRRFSDIGRRESKGGDPPAGFYISVRFATQFANEKRPVREMVSFHLDSDKIWRVSGYTLR